LYISERARKEGEKCNDIYMHYSELRTPGNKRQPGMYAVGLARKRQI
jgi:hypothetical protein